VIQKPPENLHELLALILQTQTSCLERLGTAQADLYALTLTVGALIPGAEEVLQKAIAASRQKHAEELQAQMQQIELIRATVSKMVQ
jgi:hypothetical protein